MSGRLLPYHTQRPNRRHRYFSHPRVRTRIDTKYYSDFLQSGLRQGGWLATAEIDGRKKKRRLAFGILAACS